MVFPAEIDAALERIPSGERSREAILPGALVVGPHVGSAERCLRDEIQKHARIESELTACCRTNHIGKTDDADAERLERLG
jgi:hypothetical protein